MEEEGSCLCFSTCDTQGLGKEPRNEENQKQKVKQQNYWKLMAEEKKDYEKAKEWKKSFWTKENMMLSASKVDNSTYSTSKGRDEYIIL